MYVHILHHLPFPHLCYSPLESIHPSLSFSCCQIHEFHMWFMLIATYTFLSLHPSIHTYVCKCINVPTLILIDFLVWLETLNIV